MAIPVHPGRMIKRELKARRVSGHKLALELRVPPDRISKILNGKRGITADTALRLGRYFGTGPRLWMALQSAYDLAVAEAEDGKDIKRAVRAAA